MDDETTAANVLKLLEPPSPLIFLSYAREDRDRVKSIYRRLRTEHLNPWIDIDDIMPGQQWDEVIVKTIKKARFVMLFLSNHSVGKRGYIQKEIKEALDAAEMLPDGEIFIIPVRLEPCDVPDRLAKLHWIDISKRNALKRIVQTIKDNLDLENVSDRGSLDGQLIVMGDEGIQALFPLQKAVSLLGRGSRTGSLPDINLSRFDPSRKISRTHALIFHLGNSFILKDCGSRNNTVINEKTILKRNQSRIL